MRKITFGADPELFIINNKTGKVVSSIGLIPGEKNNAYHADDMPKGFGIEIDNILAEFNIPAATNREGFVHSILYMQNYIRDFVQKVNPDYDIKCSASELVDEDQLQAPEAKLFGCDPDYNAHTGEVNPKPNGDKGNLRSAGFHIHIGYPKFNPAMSLQIVKFFDETLGLMSVLLDGDKNRRKLYGKAGSFRLQPWGVEYRVLSSAMMKSEELLTLVYDVANFATEKALNHIPLKCPEETVVRAINTSNKKLATALLTDYYPELMQYPPFVKLLNKK